MASEQLASPPSRSSSSPAGSPHSKQQYASAANTTASDATAELGEVARAALAGQEPKFVEGGWKLYSIVMGLTMAVFLVLLDSSIIATAIPKITSEFHSLEDIGWYGSAYQITSAAVQPLVGRLATQFSKKWIFISFFIVFEVGSLICGAAPSSKVLIIGRAVAGIGIAGVFSIGLAVTSTSIHPRIRTTILSAMIGICQLGIVLGPLIGGAFTGSVSWRWCFYINLPLGAVVLGGLLFVEIPDQQQLSPPGQAFRNLSHTIDFVGFALFGGSAVMLLRALQWGGKTYAWGDSTIIGLFVGAGVSFILFGAWTARYGEGALIPPKMLKSRIMIAAAGLQLFMMGTNLTISYWLPLYFQTVQNKSPVISGVDLLPSILPSVVMGILAGVLVSKVGYYLPQTVAGCMLVTVGYGLLTTLDPDSSVGEWAGYQVISSFGRGFMQQTAYTAVTAAFSPELVPVAMSLLGSAQYLGGAIFLSLDNVIFSAKLQSQLTMYAPGVDSERLVEVGASPTEVRALVPADQLDGVLKAYTVSIDNVMYLAVGGAFMMVVSGAMSGWVDTRQAKRDAEAKDEENRGAGETNNPGTPNEKK